MQFPRFALVLLCTVVAACGPQGGDDGVGVDAQPPPPSADDPDDPGDGEEPSCSEVRPIEVTRSGPPDLLLVVDRSDSMNWQLDGGETKWPVMRDAVDGMVTDKAEDIHFGLVMYPSDNGCSIGAIYADVAADTEPSITAALASTVPGGGTPTHTTMQGVLNYFDGIPENPDGRYVLLATDGEPNCGDLINPSNPMVTESVAAIADLADEGIPTYVLGFGNGINNQPQTLQDMATAGGTGTYYAANSPLELSQALDDIASKVEGPGCSMELSETPPNADRLAVFFDGSEVPRSKAHTDGFDYDASTNTITFYGDACTRLDSGDVEEVQVEYGCGGSVVD